MPRSTIAAAWRSSPRPRRCGCRPPIDLAAIVIGALTGGLLAAREGFAVSGVLLLAVSGGLGGGLIRDVLLARRHRRSRSPTPAYLPTVAVTAAVTFFFSGWLVAAHRAARGAGRGHPRLLHRDRRAEGAAGRAAERLGGVHRHADGGRRRRDPRRAARPAGRHRPARARTTRSRRCSARAAAHRPGRARWAWRRCPVAAVVIVLVAGLRRAVGVAGLGGAGRRRPPARARNRLGSAPAGRPDVRRRARLRGHAGAARCRRDRCGPASAGAAQSCGCRRTASTATSSSASGRNSRSQHPVAELAPAAGRRTSRSTAQQLVGAGVDVAVAPLDQPVGVEQHGRTPARGRRRARVRVALRGHAEQQVGGARSSSSARLPSAVRTTGGGCPALDQRSSTRPCAAGRPASCSRRADQRRRHRVEGEALRSRGRAR